MTITMTATCTVTPTATITPTDINIDGVYHKCDCRDDVTLTFTMTIVVLDVMITVVW